MSSQPSNLFALARSKLNPPSADSKDSFSLHRWVLLKNSVIRSIPLVSASSSSESAASAAAPPEEDEADDEGDSFMFPDAGNLGLSKDATASEAAWLDSLLETLGDDDDDDLASDVHVSVAPVDDDEDFASPPISPMSSSDDLTSPSSYCFYPYLVPYPPFSPPTPAPSCRLVSFPSSYVDPLPFYDPDDLDDLPPVPDTIEDTSDDESDTPPTPGQSLSSLSLDPASIPLPPDHSRLRHSIPHVYSEDDDDDEYFPPLSYPEC